jgi:hypothetical protein
MYSKDYREMNPTPRVINLEINLEFIQNTQEQVLKKAIKPDAVTFQYAVMEAESWILGLNDCFSRLDMVLTNDYIQNQLGFDLATIDPEQTFYHPANIVEKIYGLVGKNYNKSKSDIYAIMSTYDKDSFIELAESEKCASFKSFHQNFEFP